MQKWQIHFHSPAKIHIFYITKNKCLLRFHNINIFNISGAEGATRGCRYLSRGCTCLKCTNKTIGALLAYLVHYYSIGALETSAPPESPYSRYCTFSATYNE